MTSEGRTQSQLNVEIFEFNEFINLRVFTVYVFVFLFEIQVDLYHLTYSKLQLKLLARLNALKATYCSS